MISTRIGVTRELSNNFTLLFATVYSLYHLRSSQTFYTYYLFSAIYAFFLLAPQHLQWFQKSLVDVIEAQPLAAFAALFAYVGWRESSMTTDTEREDALRTRLEGWEREFNGIQMTINGVRVIETKRNIYRFLRYFLLTKFRGRTSLLISLQAAVDPERYDIINNPGLANTHINRFDKVGSGEYILQTKSTDPDTVGLEFKKLLRSFGIFNEVIRKTTGRRRTELELGRVIQPTVDYFLPKGVLQGILFRNELPKVKSINKPNIHIKYSPEKPKKASTVDGSPAMTCVYEEQSGEVNYFRRPDHLIKMNVPDFLLSDRLCKLLSMLSLTPSTWNPMYRGIERLDSCFANIQIMGVGNSVYKDGDEYKYLEIKDENIDTYQNRVQIPITNYRLSAGTDTTTLGQTSSYAASEIRYDPNPEEGRGKLSAVYSHEPDQFEVSWPDANDENFIEAEVAINDEVSPYTSGQQCVIWRREN